MNPFPVGITPGPSVELAPAPTVAATWQSLAAVAKDLHLYTPAIVQLFVPDLPFDPFAAYLAETGKTVTRVVIRTGAKLFTSLDHSFAEPAWEHTLHALPHADWPEFCAWFGTCAYRDHSKLIYRVRTQEISVADPTQLASPASVAVTAFVLEMPTGSIYFRQLRSPAQALYEPYFDKTQAYSDTQLLGIGIDANPSDPYGFVRQHLENQ